jgi:NTE family protein
LTNPVPVSLCRALGADIVIAVNLSRDIVVRSFPKKVRSKSFEKAVISSLLTPIPQTIQDTASSISEYIIRARDYFSSNAGDIKQKIQMEHQQEKLITKTENNTIAEKDETDPEDEFDDGHPPHMLKVITTAINIMVKHFSFYLYSYFILYQQHRIIASRLAGDPPEIELNPKLGGMDTFDFEKAEFAINAGYNCVEHSLHQIQDIISHYH